MKAPTGARRARSLAHYLRRRAEVALTSIEWARCTANILRLTADLRAAKQCETCGRPLKDPTSVRRGKGPDCWAKREEPLAQPVETS